MSNDFIIYRQGVPYRLVKAEDLGQYLRCIDCKAFLTSVEDKLKTPGVMYRFFHCKRCGNNLAYLLRYQVIPNV